MSLPTSKPRLDLVEQFWLLKTHLYKVSPFHGPFFNDIFWAKCETKTAQFSETILGLH